MLPDFSLTNRILNHVATSEYFRAVIDSQVLPTDYLEKSKQTNQVHRVQLYTLESKQNIDLKEIKNVFVYQKPQNNAQQIVHKLKKAFDYIQEAKTTRELVPEELMQLAHIITGSSRYRSFDIPQRTNKQEIVAKVAQICDWQNSRDALETHAIIAAAVLHGALSIYVPFEQIGSTLTCLSTLLLLQKRGLRAAEHVLYERALFSSSREQVLLLEDLFHNEDYTDYIEYFCEGFAREIAQTAESAKLATKEHKVRKTAKTTNLNSRQKLIVEFVEDYGLLQNKDFVTLFPDLSEDTVLRELKSLVDKKILTKTGKTKSSRYELG